MSWKDDNFGRGGQRGYSGPSMVRAWEDRERLMREAEGYREDLIPKARERLYWGTLDKVLPGREKYILPPEGKVSVLKAMNLLQEPYEMMFHTVFHPAGMKGI